MNKYIIIAVAFITFACSKPTAEMEDTKIQAPTCKKIPKELTIHGDTRIDNYFWLNERENPEVIDYLNAENTYADSVLGHTKDFQTKLFEEIKGRIKQTDESVPYKRNGYFYYTRYEEGKEYGIYCRKQDSLENEEQIMLDENQMAEGHAYHAIGGINVSPNNKMIAFGVDTVSRRIYTIKFKNLETGEILDDKIEGTVGSVAWANDNKTVFYTKKDLETLRSYQVWKHTLGSDKDELIFQEDDETFDCWAYRSKSGNYVIINTSASVTSEYRVLDANTPNAEFKIFQERTRELEYSIANFEDKFYVLTNLDGAKNFKLMVTDANATEKENWKEVIAHREDVMIEDFEIFRNHLTVDERKDGLSHIRIFNNETGEDHYLDFGEETYTAYLSTNLDFESELVRYGYMSLTTPNSVFDYNMNSKEKELLKQTEVLGDFNKHDYQSERHYAIAKDGTKVPISLVYKKGLKRDGNNPTLLYGYGSYGATMDPYFSSVRLSLLNRGFVYAIAHIRGGEEMGRYWYDEGKMLNKKNTFTDFIACGEYLITENFTNRKHLYAMGGSAGGLLMGAIINMRPDLWNGVVAQVPFVDVITTMLDESIPLTTGEYDEWGNPNEKEYYDYIKSYSPYDNIEAKAYPNMLVTTGLHDSQVQYWEPAKWVAKLRELKTDDNMLLLKTNMDAGHGGASGRFEAYKEYALEYAFLLNLEGINE